MSALRRAAGRLLPPSLKAALRRLFPSLSGRPGSRQLRARAFPPALTPGDYDVIVLPIIDWFFLFQRPQQLSLEFARNGRRVFYLDQAALRDGPWAGPGREPEAIWIEENVALAGGVAGRPVDIYRDSLDEAQVERMLASLALLRRRYDIRKAVCLVQLPFWTPLALRLRREWGWTVAYDCIDEHAGFLTNSEEMLASEQRLVREAELVVVTSRYLQEKVCPDSRRCLLLPNAADFEHFQPARRPLPVDERMERLRRPVIGYYGCISSWFDMGLVCSAAEARPEWSFVLIGSDLGLEGGWRGVPANVHFLGRRPYSELAAYLSRFDVCCIPFKINPLTIASNPVKFFEYLSAGKPVVATPLPELKPYGDHVRLVEGRDEFVRAVEEALAEDDPSQVEARIALARANTWQARYRELDGAFLSLPAAAVESGDEGERP